MAMASTPCNKEMMPNHATRSIILPESTDGISMSSPPLQKKQLNCAAVNSPLYLLRLDKELRAQREVNQLTGASQSSNHFSAHVASAMRVPDDISLEQSSFSLRPIRNRLPQSLNKIECPVCARQAMETPKKGNANETVSSQLIGCTCNALNTPSQTSTYLMTPPSFYIRSDLQLKRQLPLQPSFGSNDDGCKDDLYINSLREDENPSGRICLDMPRMSSSTPTSPSKPWIIKKVPGRKPPVPLFQVDCLDDDIETSHCRIQLQPKRRKSRSNSSSPMHFDSSLNNSSEGITGEKIRESTGNIISHAANSSRLDPFLPAMTPENHGKVIRPFPNFLSKTNNIFPFPPYSPQTPVA